MYGDKLKDVLMSIDCDVKIGTKDGSGYLCCGHPAELTGIYPWDDELLKKMNDSLDVEKEAFLRKVRSAPTPASYIEAHYKRGDYFCYEGYVNVLQDFFKSCQNKKNAIDRMKNKIKEHVALSEREVIEEYPSIDEDAIILIVEGSEQGKYWTVKEYRNWEDANEND